MAGTLGRIALVVSSVLVTFFLAAAGLTAGSPDQCMLAFNICMAGCPTWHPQAYNNCASDCASKVSQCISGSSLPGSTAPSAVLPPDSTGTPPKGQGLRQPIGTSGDKQVGGGTSPKGKGPEGAVGVSGDKQLGSGKSPKGKIGLGKVNVEGVKPLGTGASSQPNTKVKVDSGAVKVKQFNESWSSPSTSGGTKMMEGSGKRKKH